jgi:transposase-like protein
VKKGEKLEHFDGSGHAVGMQTLTSEPMEPSEQFCPNPMCSARGQRGLGNIAVHDRKRQRYRCKHCKHTCSARRGTRFEGLRKPSELIVIVVTLLAFGCPVQAIVQAFGLHERTVASWRDRAGKQCQRVHQAIVEQRQWDLVHVQADEIRGKARGMVVWMALSLMVSTRLWLGGVVSQSRDTRVGGSAPAAGAGLLPECLRGAHLHRWLGRVSGQYQTCLPREDQADGGTWASAAGTLVGLAHRDGDQAHRSQTAYRSSASDEARHAGGGDAPLAALGWRADAQHVLH